MRCSTSNSTLLTLCSAALLALAACSSDRNDTNLPKVTDSGVNTIPDTGVVNNTDGGTNTNDGGPTCNNTCGDPNQLIGAPPNCECLTVCRTGYVWNAGTMHCDPINNPDGGVPNNDGGVPNNDGGVGADGGPPPATCANNAACMTGEECVDVATGDTANPCPGGATCQCFTTCTPNQTASGCQTGEACLWLFPGTRGICIQDQPGGGVQAGACTATFDTGGVRQGDSCAVNFYCWGASAQAPTGICARFCPPGAGTLCSGLGNYTCADVGQTPGQIGLCFDPPQTFTDLGNACTAPTGCMSQVCLGNEFCGSDCGGLAQCPTGGVCVGTGTDNFCVLECTFGAAGDTFCNGRNTNITCENIAAPADPPFGVCLPKCTQNADCGTGGTCTVATGHCT